MLVSTRMSVASESVSYSGSSYAVSKKLPRCGHDLDEVLAEQTPSSRTRARESPLYPKGRAQFLAAITHIRQENPGRQPTSAAGGRGLRRLEQFPESGRVVPEFPELPYREVIVSPYASFTAQGDDRWCRSVAWGATADRATG